MKKALLCLLLSLPSASFAQSSETDKVLGLSDENESVYLACSNERDLEYADVRISVYAGSQGSNHYDGHLATGDVYTDIDIYDGLNNITVLYIDESEGFVLHYAISLADLSYDFTASGSKHGFGKGTCEIE